MGKIFFLFKIVFFAVLVFAFLQIKIGDFTLEERLLKTGHFGFASELVEKIEFKALSSVREQNKKTGSQIDSFLEKKMEKLQTKSESDEVESPDDSAEKKL